MDSYRTPQPETEAGASSSRLWSASPFVLVFWLVAALLFVSLDGWRTQVTTVVYVAVAVFALFATFTATRRKSGRRAFWSLIFAALAARLLGDGLWGIGLLLDGVPPLWSVYAVYGVSYLLFSVAMLRLVFETSRQIIFIVALDAIAITSSVGMIAWYFALGVPAGQTAASPVLASFACGAGLLFLCLTVLSSERSPVFIGALSAAFGAFFLGGGLYLAAHASGPYEPGGWPEMLWALGLALFGLAAAKPVAPSGVGEEEIHPWRVFSFWFGPLSPAIHCAFLLAWGAFNPPLPSYVPLVSAAIMVYLAFRISFTAYVSRRLRLAAQSLAVRGEQGRISEELHDTLKQSVYSVLVLLESYRKSDETDDAQSRQTLARAIEAAREANYQVGRPIDELRARWAGEDQDPSPLLGVLLKDFEKLFGIRPHEDLRADLTRLSPEELAAAYRIASEALWNAAKHSGATNVWLESREVGISTIIRIRDDGRGFFESETASGYGLSSMRDRAERSSGDLNIISDPLSGTTVQVRFEKTPL